MQYLLCCNDFDIRATNALCAPSLRKVKTEFQGGDGYENPLDGILEPGHAREPPLHKHL